MKPSDLPALDAYWYGRLVGLNHKLGRGQTLDQYERQLLCVSYLGIESSELTDVQLLEASTIRFKVKAIAHRLTK